MGYQLIETIEIVSGGLTYIDMDNIPQDGADLLVLISGRSTLATNETTCWCYLNKTSTSTTSQQILGYGGLGIVSVNNFTQPAIGNIPGAQSTANTFGVVSAYIPNYTLSGDKSMSGDGVSENNASRAVAMFSAIRRAGLGAVTSLRISGNGFAIGTTASLYKITAD